jgi:hypothetical protein
MRHVPRLRRLLLLTAVLVAGTCVAQQPTAQITGIITDASGAVIPDARITAANINTGVQAVSQSNESGNYVFSNLTAGTYTLSVQKGGFSTVERREIALAVSQNARIDFSLAVGSTTETVEIHASPPLLEASSASIGQQFPIFPSTVVTSSSLRSYRAAYWSPSPGTARPRAGPSLRMEFVPSSTISSLMESTTTPKSSISRTVRLL